MKTRREWRGFLSSVTGLAIVLVAWLVVSLFVEDIKVPSPLRVFRGFLTSPFYDPKIAWHGGGTRGFAPHLLYTARNYFIATSAGIFLGIGVGLLMGWSKRILDLLEPPLEILRTIPSLAALPFFLMWFGPSAMSQIALIIFYCFLMIVINTLNAVRNVNPTYRNFAFTLGATRGQVFRTVVLPAIVPELLGGIRVALAVSWGIVVVAELMGSFLGVGKLFLIFIPYFYSTGIFVGIIWILLFATITDMVFMRVIHPPITKWMHEEI